MKHYILVFNHEPFEAKIIVLHTQGLLEGSGIQIECDAAAKAVIGSGPEDDDAFFRKRFQEKLRYLRSALEDPTIKCVGLLIEANYRKTDEADDEKRLSKSLFQCDYLEELKLPFGLFSGTKMGEIADKHYTSSPRRRSLYCGWFKKRDRSAETLVVRTLISRIPENQHVPDELFIPRQEVKPSLVFQMDHFYDARDFQLPLTKTVIG